MSFVRDAVLLLHLVGFASLLGGYLVQINARAKVNSAMAYGALAEVLTGIALVVLADIHPHDDFAVDNVHMGVKLAIALVAAVLAMANRRREKVPIGLFHFIGLLALADTVIAVFWP